MRYVARVGDKEVAVEIRAAADGTFALSGTGARARLCGGSVLLSSGDRTIEAVVTRSGSAGGYFVTIAGRTFSVTLEDPRGPGRPAAGPGASGPAEITSVMPGKVVALLVQKGQEIKSGQGLVVIEAMKMENEIPSPRNGRVKEIRVGPGETVEAGAVLLVVE